LLWNRSGTDHAPIVTDQIVPGECVRIGLNPGQKTKVSCRNGRKKAEDLWLNFVHMVKAIAPKEHSEHCTQHNIQV